MSTQPALSFELGRRIFFTQNNLPEIVVFHLINTNTEKKYPFGVIITGDNAGFMDSEVSIDIDGDVSQ